MIIGPQCQLRNGFRVHTIVTRNSSYKKNGFSLPSLSLFDFIMTTLTPRSIRGTKKYLNTIIPTMKSPEYYNTHNEATLLTLHRVKNRVHGLCLGPRRSRRWNASTTRCRPPNHVTCAWPKGIFVGKDWKGLFPLCWMMPMKGMPCVMCACLDCNTDVNAG